MPQEVEHCVERVSACGKGADLGPEHQLCMECYLEAGRKPVGGINKSRWLRQVLQPQNSEHRVPSITVHQTQSNRFVHRACGRVAKKRKCQATPPATVFGPGAAVEVVMQCCSPTGRNFSSVENFQEWEHRGTLPLKIELWQHMGALFLATPVVASNCASLTSL